LVARCNIKSGTRILCEKPLFILRGSKDFDSLQKLVASELRSLSKEEQRQFLSMHNNHPGRHPFAGTFRTNSLPCGPGAATGGVYPEICLINHCCLPNCYNSWNTATQRETIHATRDILAGEEITISYNKSPHAQRQNHLKVNFGFTCDCELCSLPPEELHASDELRQLIEELDEQIGNPFTMRRQPDVSLHRCKTLLELLVKEYGISSDISHEARCYYDAFQIAIAHGDQARAQVFAERAYRARVACEGEDSPTTQRFKALMQKPDLHENFAGYSSKWRTSKTARPRNLDDGAFEKWLWRL
jgi:hypothetical protein